MIDVVTDVASLQRSEMGSITGQVFLRGPAGHFPEDRWSDFPVVVLAWWIDGLVKLLESSESSFQGEFMDGPFAFVVHRGVGSSGRIAWGEADNEVSVGILDVADLLRSAVIAARQVNEACRSRRWDGRDLDDLERAIARSAL